MYARWGGETTRDRFEPLARSVPLTAAKAANTRDRTGCDAHVGSVKGKPAAAAAAVSGLSAAHTDSATLQSGGHSTTTSLVQIRRKKDPLSAIKN